MTDQKADEMIGHSDDPYEQETLGWEGRTVDARSYEDKERLEQLPTYTIKVRCDNCNWRGRGTQTKGKSVTDSTYWTSVECPYCGCERVVNDA